MSDAGRYRIVDASHGDHVIKMLAPEGVSLPSENAHVHFDPNRTQVYADGWVIN